MKILRLVIGTLIPPALGCIFILVGGAIFSPQKDLSTLSGLICFGLLFSYLIMFIPSFLFSVIMETVVRTKKENIGTYYGAAAGLGWASTLVLSFDRIDNWLVLVLSLDGIDNWLVFAGNSFTGILVGVITAFVLRHVECFDSDKGYQHNETCL